MITISKSTHADQTYTQSYAQGSQTMSFTENAISCATSDIVYSLAVSPDTGSEGLPTSFITLSNGVVSWSRTSVLQAGVFVITVTGTITALSTHTASTQFKLTTTYPPCSETPESITISGTPVSNKNYEYYDLMGSQYITPFTENSFSCAASDIVHTMSVTDPLNQDNLFI